MGTEKETMGKRISQLMEAKRHTQSSLAAALGTTRATVHQWVHDVSKPTPENLLWLADELGTDAHYLVFGPVEDQYGSARGLQSAHITFPVRIVWIRILILIALPRDPLPVAGW
jgi:transcriptional regulator with XRE-family HTH domain